MKGESRGNIYIGISGWRYPPWRGVFYPPDLPQRRELEYASRLFRTIEINGSFYSLQRPADYDAWYHSTPENFVFSIKGGRYITHILRLKGVEQALANFFASGIFNLREKMGPFLWQFPPNLRYREELFERFFDLLPFDTGSALSLARKRDRRMTGRARIAVDQIRPVRHAVEVRHPSFRDERFIRQLRRHGIALVVADTAGKWPLLEDLTADFSYIRLHGDEELYVSGYTPKALVRWAGRINQWARGRQPADASLACSELHSSLPSARDVYCYFDNDVKVRAPFDAALLLKKLNLPAPASGDRSPIRAFSSFPSRGEAIARAGNDPRWDFSRKRTR